MNRMSRTQRDEAVRQIREIKRRLRDNDWSDVDMEDDTEDDTPAPTGLANMAKWRKPSGHLPPPDGANPLPPGYKDAD